MVQHTAVVSPETISETGVPKTRLGVNIAITLFLLLVAVLAIYQHRAPRPVASNAPPMEFSSGRAMTHLGMIAQKPHPIGSSEHDAVREYILKELRATGLEPEVQKTTVVNPAWTPPYPAATVQNIAARLKGTGAGGRAVLLMAHYDSVPTSPGASDNGAGVSALLETSRALKAGAPLLNDVIFLFTDGEEIALLGAQAFVAEHPWYKDVNLVLNFEARGTSGPAMMFETSDANRWLVEGFAQAAPHPVANSLMYDIYRLLPNDSDLTILKRRGVPGFNFAFINDAPNYHNSLDNLAQLDEGSLQHQGSYALSLTRHFGDGSLQPTTTTNAVYFDIFGLTVIHYSYTWILPLTALTLLLFAGALVFGFRKKHLTVSGVALGALIFLLSLAAATAGVVFLWWLVGRVHTGYRLLTLGDTYNGNLYRLSFVALAVAVTSAMYSLAGKRINASNLTVGALLWWALLLVASSVLLPGGSFLLVWPLIFMVLGLYVAFVGRREESMSAKRRVLFALCAVPGIILLAPLIHITLVGLTLSMSGAVMILVVLLVGLLIPQLVGITGAKRWAMPAVAALVCVCFLAAGSFTARFDVNKRQPNSIFYGLNADTGQGVWGSPDEYADEWTGQFFTAGSQRGTLYEYFPLSGRIFLKNQTAPAVMSLAAPEMKVLEDVARDGVRHLRVLITSPRQAPVMSIYEESNSEIVGIALGDKRMDSSLPAPNAGQRRKWGMRYYALPPEGVELTFAVKESQPFKFRLVDQSYQLPDTQTASYKPRPDHMMPAMTPYTDASFVSKTFAF
jgi:MFS family permease